MGRHSTHNHSKSIWIQKGIKNNKVYPYHPQTNLVKIFMRPLGKARKIAHDEHQNKDGKAHAKHLEQGQKRRQKLNASRHSKTSCVEPGQLVLAQNFKHAKFHL